MGHRNRNGQIERRKAAEAVQSVVGGTISHEGGVYDCYSVTDLRGRKWKVVRDASLISVPSHLQSEVVSPVMTLKTFRNCRKSSAPCGKPRPVAIHVAECTYMLKAHHSTPKSSATLPKWFTKTKNFSFTRLASENQGWRITLAGWMKASFSALTTKSLEPWTN